MAKGKDVQKSVKTASTKTLKENVTLGNSFNY